MPQNHSTDRICPMTPKAGKSVQNCEQGVSNNLNTFSKAQRLLNSDEFSKVFNDAPFRASNPQFLILSRPNQHSAPRLGIVVAKKHVRKAHARNRIKRLIRESFRQKQHHLPAIDAIVLARKGADTLTNPETYTALDGLWKRLSQKAKRKT